MPIPRSENNARPETGAGRAASWQACCITSGMNDIAYDISHLLDVERQQADVPAPRVVRAVPTVPARVARSGVAEAQEALARELIQCAPIHDAMVQQYLRMSGETFREGRAG